MANDPEVKRLGLPSLAGVSLAWWCHRADARRVADAARSNDGDVPARRRPGAVTCFGVRLLIVQA